jgi:hypothetical protein
MGAASAQGVGGMTLRETFGCVAGTLRAISSPRETAEHRRTQTRSMRTLTAIALVSISALVGTIAYLTH